MTPEQMMMMQTGMQGLSGALSSLGGGQQQQGGGMNPMMQMMMMQKMLGQAKPPGMPQGGLQSPPATTMAPQSIGQMPIPPGLMAAFPGGF